MCGNNPFAVQNIFADREQDDEAERSTQDVAELTLNLRHDDDGRLEVQWPVELTVRFENLEQLRAMRRFLGGITRNQTEAAFVQAAVDGPDSDMDMMWRMLTGLYEIVGPAWDDVAGISGEVSNDAA